MTLLASVSSLSLLCLPLFPLATDHTSSAAVAVPPVPLPYCYPCARDCRLGIHNELCAVKWGDDGATEWKRLGFPLSKRVASAKRHYDGVHSRDRSEDHIAHLIWNLMALYHVRIMFPDKNDLPVAASSS